MVFGTLDQPADITLSSLARSLATWQVATKVAAYVVADKDNPSTDEQTLLTALRKLFHIDLVDDDDVTDAKMDFTAYSAIVVGGSCDVTKLPALTDLAIPLVFTKGEHAATIGKMATVGVGNYGTSVGTQWDLTDNSHPTVLTEVIGVHTLYTENGNLNWLLNATLATGTGVFANVKNEATHISLAILPLDGINSDGLASPEIRYFLGLPEVSKYTDHTWEHVTWIGDWLVHQIALVTIVYSLTKSKIIEEMLGKGKFKKITDLYDYLVTGTTGSPPFEVITESKIGSVMERLEWIKNKLEIPLHFPSAEVLDDIPAITPTDTTEKTITVSLPIGATIVRVMLTVFITAMNNTANAQKIDIDVKGRKGAGAWSTFFSQDDCIGFPAADGATTGTVPLQDVSALVDVATSYGFKCTITQSSANSVRYTTQYLLIVTYKMS